MSRVAIVGVEGSGKTVLMAALADRYGTPSDDSMYLMPENQSAFTFMKHIPHKMREEHQWPAATTIESFKHLKWSVRIGPEALLDLEMLDYPGEIYRLAFGERSEEEIAPNRERLHEFLEHLVTADILVVLFNLQDAMDVGGNHRNTETVWLTRGIFDYAKKLPNIKRRLLLFTQADRYQDELTRPGGVETAKDKHLPMMRMLFPDLPCAAVSVATDTATTPALEFSKTHGIAGFMNWLSSNTEERLAALETLESIECALVSGTNYDKKSITALISILDNLTPDLCDRVALGLREKLLEECHMKLIRFKNSRLYQKIEKIARRKNVSINQLRGCLRKFAGARVTNISALDKALFNELTTLINLLRDSNNFGFFQKLSRANWKPFYKSLQFDVSRSVLQSVECCYAPAYRWFFNALKNAFFVFAVISVFLMVLSLIVECY